MTDQDDANIDSIEEFPGYCYEASNADGMSPAITGVKPIKKGPVTIMIGYGTSRLSVDVSVDPIESFEKKHFDTIELYPSKPTGSSKIGYGIGGIAGHITLSLKLIAKKQQIQITIETSGAIHKAYGGFKKRPFPYSTFKMKRFPEFHGGRDLSISEVQQTLDKGKWHEAPARALSVADTSSNSTLTDIITLLGATDDVRANQEVVAGGLGQNETWLGAFGAAVNAGDGISGIGGAAGIYFTANDIGWFGEGALTFGAVAGTEAMGELAVYWPWGDESAFERFNGVDIFAEVSGAWGLAGSLRLSFDDKFRPSGVTLGIGGGAELEVATGISACTAHSFVRNR